MKIYKNQVYNYKRIYIFIFSTNSTSPKSNNTPSQDLLHKKKEGAPPSRFTYLVT